MKKIENSSVFLLFSIAASGNLLQTKNTCHSFIYRFIG